MQTVILTHFILLFTLTLADVIGDTKHRWLHQECYEPYEQMECTPDGKGYTKYQCDYDKYIYQRGPEVWCPSEKPKCRCFINIEPEGSPQHCVCVNSRSIPRFPRIGVIRWNGTSVKERMDYDIGRIVRYQATIRGEVHKNSNGRYLKKWTFVRWPNYNHKIPSAEIREEFEMVVPSVDGRGFVKYAGSEASRKCTKEEVSSPPQMSWENIWEKHPRKYYQLTKETSKEEGVTTQTWEQREIGYTGEEEWDWKVTVSYDGEADHAIPMTYVHRYVGTWDAERLDTKLTYEFEPIGSEETSFDIEDFCDDV